MTTDANSRRRVVVTGLGAVSPLGLDIASTWDGLMTARSAVAEITRFDASGFESPIGAEIRDFRAQEHMTLRQARVMDRSSQFGVTAALEALADAALGEAQVQSPQTGVIFGCSLGGYNFLEAQLPHLLPFSLRRLNPHTLAAILPDSVSGHIAILTGAMGPNMAFTTASATGATAIGEASEIIRRGDADVMIAGACEAPLTPVLFAAFAALRGMARAEGDPTTACRPFDAQRSGFVLGEGAAAVILESLEHATARGARIYSELAGYGTANDAYHMVAEEPSGRGLVASLQTALRKADLPPEAIGYLNAHGTASRMNDPMETGVYKQVFGKHAYRLAVSSTKSMTGHLMGAAGALEAVITVLALHHRTLPPTINYTTPDPECDLDYVPNTPRPAPDLAAAISDSIGLGGHNAALVFRRL